MAEAHDRIGAVIHDLLELGRAGMDAPDIGAIPISDVVESCLQDIEAGEQRSVTYTDFAVRADGRQLQLLVGNLIGNAIEHGGVAVTVEVGTLPDGFSLEDDGQGIPEDERRIFAPMNGISSGKVPTTPAFTDTTVKTTRERSNRLART